MNKKHKLFLQALVGQPVKRNPVWLMRQAGRYLPEYQQVRATFPNFIDLCLNAKCAAEITLQPIRRFDFDAAILFSDILMVPHALGQHLAYKEGEGPFLDPIQDEKKLALLRYRPEIVEPVFETMRLVKATLDESKARIGFCGGLWTVACYMIEGRGKQGFTQALNCVRHQPEFLTKLMELLHETTLSYLRGQIEAGAEVIQIFDSWAGLLSEKKFKHWVIDPTRRLVQALEAEFPDIPIIGFPRGAKPADYKAYVMTSGVDALSFDENISLTFALDELKAEKPLQGNLDPQILVEGGEKMQKAVEKILETFGPNHLFNLGHGVLPHTPLENVAELVQLVREAEFSEE